MTAGDRRLLVWGTAIIALSSLMALILSARLARPVLVIDVVVAILLCFVAWSTEPDDPDDFAPAADLAADGVT